jgi:hypothetical protein
VLVVLVVVGFLLVVLVPLVFAFFLVLVLLVLALGNGDSLLRCLVVAAVARKLRDVQVTQLLGPEMKSGIASMRSKDSLPFSSAKISACMQVEHVHAELPPLPLGRRAVGECGLSSAAAVLAEEGPGDDKAARRRVLRRLRLQFAAGLQDAEGGLRGSRF